MVEHCAGLDISAKSTEISVVNGTAETVWAGACASDPKVIARTQRAQAPGLVRSVLETGPLSTFLYHGLAERARW